MMPPMGNQGYTYDNVSPQGPAVTDSGLILPEGGGSFSRRALLGSILAGAALLTGSEESEAAKPVALVYRGPASRPGTAEAAVRALAHRGALTPRYVGPGERTRLTAAALRSATLYVQPGGGSVYAAWPHMRP